MTQILRGNYPILATPWTDDGRFDATSHARLIDWLIDSGVHGLVMAANASEGHAQSDAERDRIVAAGMKRVAGRVPVIVTVTHFATEVAIEKARRAEALGAASVMSMPQFFGNWGADLPATAEYFHALADAIRIPVMVQDHPVCGVAMNAEFLARLASEIPRVAYFKLEFTQSPYKMARVLALAGKSVPGMFGGESGLYFIEEHERGGSGTMPACYLPRVFSETFRRLEAGDVKGARAGFDPYIPLLNFELRLANRNLWKCILKHLGVIASDRIRGPLPRYWDAKTRRQCFDHVRRLDPATFGVPVRQRPMRVLARARPRQAPLTSPVV
jgi:dihydrodipicolinate synthase/N-acetylneuraminate lyase